MSDDVGADKQGDRLVAGGQGRAKAGKAKAAAGRAEGKRADEGGWPERLA